MAYRAAIAADPGYAITHNNLGLPLEIERKDIEGAEAAYRAAIAADPGYAGAHANLACVRQSAAEPQITSNGFCSKGSNIARARRAVSTLSKPPSIVHDGQSGAWGHASTSAGGRGGVKGCGLAVLARRVRGGAAACV